MNFVCNAGPVIALAKIGRLDTLGQIGSQVWIPETVFRELLAKPGEETNRILAASRSFLRVCTPEIAIPAAVAAAVRQLDPGEAEVISLAVSRGAAALLDDAAGRRVAQALGIPFMGFTGLLLTAKRKGLVPQVTPLLLQARSNGYWLSDDLIETARKLAHE